MSLDAVRALNERMGLGLEIIGTDDRGQSGAVSVRWPDGRDAVVTTALTSLDHMRQTRDVLDSVRRRGVPVPHHQALLPLADGTVAVAQEKLTGRLIVNPSEQHVRTVVALNERFAGLLADEPDVPLVALSLGRPGDAIPTEPIASHSTRAQRLLRVIRHIAADAPRCLAGNDLVHVDLTIPNVLFDDAGNSLTGVIDWNYGVARGDRRYGLVKLLHNLSYAAMAPSEVQRPAPSALAAANAAVADAVDPDVFRWCWAHQTVNALYGSRRWGTDAAVARYLELGEQRLS